MIFEKKAQEVLSVGEIFNKVENVLPAVEWLKEEINQTDTLSDPIFLTVCGGGCRLCKISSFSSFFFLILDKLQKHKLETSVKQ